MSRLERASKVNKRIDNDLQAQVMKLVDKYGDGSIFELVDDPHFDIKRAQSEYNFIINHPFIDYKNILSRIPTLPLDIIYNMVGLFDDIHTHWTNIFTKNQNLTNEFLIKLNNECNISLCNHIIQLMTRGFLVNPVDFFKLKKYGESVNAYYYAQFLLRDRTFEEMFDIYRITGNELALNMIPAQEEEVATIVLGIRDVICQHPDFDFTYLDVFGEDRNKFFNWHHLSKHKNLTLDIVIKHKTRPWMW